MTIAYYPKEDLFFSLCERIIDALIYSFALYTVCYHVAILYRVSLALLCSVRFARRPG